MSTLNKIYNKKYKMYEMIKESVCVCRGVRCANSIATYLRDTAGLIPDYHNKANIAIKRVTRLFWFPGASKNYV